MIFEPNALLVPFNKAMAQWQFCLDPERRDAIASNKNLRHFCSYLMRNQKLSGCLDTQRFSDELEHGLFLDSNIPRGYGLGSSGALVAAVYERYALRFFENLSSLKSVLAEMENSFHGNSSGNDPLQCYLGKPFKITKEKGIEVLDFDFSLSPIRVFLIDTKKKSPTGPLVDYYMAQRKQPSYLEAFQQCYLPCVSSCIDAFLEHRSVDFFLSLEMLTSMQMDFLRPMITDNTLSLFNGTFGFHFGVKILGSGGGGYVLGFTDDVLQAEKVLSDFDVVWL
jgi:Mevalonate kinase